MNEWYFLPSLFEGSVVPDQPMVIFFGVRSNFNKLITPDQ